VAVLVAVQAATPDASVSAHAGDTVTFVALPASLSGRMAVTFAPCRGEPAKSRTVTLIVVESPGTAVLRTSFDAFTSAVSQSGALSFSTKSNRDAFCVSVTIV